MIGNLNVKYLTGFFIVIFALLIGSFNSQTFDLQEMNFNTFKTRINQFMVTICDFNETRCKEQRKLFDEAAKILKEKYKIKFLFAFADPSKITGKISTEYPYEGFVTSYFVNASENIKETYVGLRKISAIMKFLEYRLVFPEDNLVEAKNEEELDGIVNKIPEKRALVLMGDIANYKNINFRLLQLASRKAGIEKIVQIRDANFLEKYLVNDYELTMYNIDNTQEEKFIRIKLKKNNEYEKDHLADLIKLVDYNRKEKNIFSDMNNENLSLTLNHGLPSINFFYSKKDTQLNENLGIQLNNLAHDYKDEFILSKGSINDPIIKELKIVRHYNITRMDLPMIMFTKRHDKVFNSDRLYGVDDFFDVEKYFLKRTDLVQFVKNNMKNYLENKLISESEIEFSIEIIEKFYEMCKEGLIEKEKVTSDLNKIEMNGHNFVQAINDALKDTSNKGIVLLICPKNSKKYARIRNRVERVFTKLFKANSEKIIFDEFDPFLNEMSFINVNSYPSIVIIQNTLEEKVWKVINFKDQLTTRDISRFIKSSFEGTIYEQDLENEREINEFERTNKLYPINRLRYEGKILIENRMAPSFNIGLKRRWNNLKRFNIIKENPIFENANVFEIDDLSDEFEMNDNVDETVLQNKADEDSIPEDNLDLDKTYESNKQDL